jgi:hypothetical protein
MDCRERESVLNIFDLKTLAFIVNFGIKSLLSRN